MPKKNGMTAPLVRTKFYRPPLPENLVPRPRLINKLNQASTRPFTLICAPAGYGKSTLLSAWLRQWPGPTAWLSLDVNDNDLRLFVAYFVTTIHSMAPDMGAATETLLNGPVLPPTAVLAANLINDLDEIQQDFVLVLDDYYRISNRKIHDVLAALLRQPPRAMHLVMATRHDPLLPRVSLLGQGKMAEIRAPELALTLAETADYLQQTLPVRPDAAVAVTLYDKTEGWVAGLRLAVLSLQYEADANAMVARLQANNRLAMDYLVAEVLAQQPPQYQDALLQTAVLGRFNSELCTAVCWPNAASTAPGRQFVAWLEENSLFIIPLNEQQEWYRYHHLFQELLQHQLRQRYTPAQLNALHGRASQWFAGQKLTSEAIQHALAGQDARLAVQAVAERRHKLMNREQWTQLGHWLRLFPADMVEEEPELLLLRAWMLYSQWRFADLPPILEQLESLLKDAPRETAVRLSGELATLRAQQFFYANQPAQAIACSQHALAQLPVSYSSVRGITWVFLAGGYYLAGEMVTAVTQVEEVLAAEQGGRASFAARLLPTLAFMHLAAANLPALTATAHRLLWLADEHQLVESFGWAHYFLGAAAYYQNDLAAAERHFLQVIRRPYVTHGHAFGQSGFGLALTYQAQGRAAEATAVAEELAAYLMEIKNAGQLPKVQAFQAHLALLQGETAVAAAWLSQATAHHHFSPMMELYAPQMTAGRALLALGQWAEADTYLGQQQTFLESVHNTRFLVELLVQRAWLHQVRGQGETAVAFLKQALTLAAPARLIRPFADYGDVLAALFAQLSRQHFLPDYLPHILAAMPTSDLAVPDFPPPLPAPTSPLVEELTNRELDVLQLMEKRLSNKEIAAELCISVVTVKRHTYNLYQKLGVHGRRQAVNEARKLGVIS